MNQPLVLSSPKYRPDIDGLRAIAVLAVVIFHAFPNLLPGGFIGVDIFFVISGYLISTIIFENLERGSFSFKEFYARRVKRIFPALILVLGASYAFGWFALLADEYKQLGKHIAGGAGFVSNFLLWNESGYFDTSAETKPLLHLWSLSIEEQFYIFFPLLVWFLWKHKINIFLMMLIFIIASFFLNYYMVDRNSVASFYFSLARFWELLCGGLLAWFLFHKARNYFFLMRLVNFFDKVTYVSLDLFKVIFLNILSFFAMFLLSYGFLKINSNLSFPGLWVLIPILGSLAVILTGPKTIVNRKFLSSKVMTWLGSISFPLYLWHWPIISFALISNGGSLSAALRLLAIILSILLAWLTYQLIELPIRSSRNYRFIISSLLVACIFSFLTGTYIYFNNGMPYRQSIMSFELKSRMVFTQDLGRPENAQIMLLGDSHAAHLVPGLKSIFGIIVADYTAPGCIPFYDVDRYDSRYSPGTCVKLMNEALSSFIENDKMKGIILSSMGPVYLTGEAFNGVDKARVSGLGVVLITKPEIKNRWEIYRQGLKSTIERMISAGKKILFVIDIPELGFDPHACFDERPLVLFSIKRNPCAVSRSDYDNRSRNYKNLVYKVLKEYPEVAIYDPTNDFCDNFFCWAIKDNEILYRDPDHLSNAGSIFFVGKMKSFIQSLE